MPDLHYQECAQVDGVFKIALESCYSMSVLPSVRTKTSHKLMVEYVLLFSICVLLREGCVS